MTESSTGASTSRLPSVLGLAITAVFDLVLGVVLVIVAMGRDSTTLLTVGALFVVAGAGMAAFLTIRSARPTEI